MTSLLARSNFNPKSMLFTFGWMWMACTCVFSCTAGGQEDAGTIESSKHRNGAIDPATEKEFDGVGADHREPGETELWVFGAPGSPERVATLNGKGVRAIIDLRTFNTDRAMELLRAYSDLDLGLCLTLRWAGDENTTARRGRGGSRVDIPPTEAEAVRALDDLVEIFNSEPARKLAGKIWVQLYNEISGGPGQFEVEYEDAMFDFATRVADRIRAETPHVKICGPSLTAITVLDSKDDASLSRIQKLRIKRLMRTIEWSAEHADAVDIHLHAEDGAWARAQLATLRRELDQFDPDRRTAIVTFEWSCARFDDRSDSAAVRQVIVDIWNVIQEHQVEIAAYAALWPGKKQKEHYQWKSLLAENGEPNEPFYSVFLELAGGAKQNSDSQAGASEEGNGADR